MDDYSEVPIPPEASEYHLGLENPLAASVEGTMEDMDADTESAWLTQQLVDAEKQMLKEKENIKRQVEESLSEDEPLSKKRANEFEKLWKNVNDNPTDFQAWTILLQHVDQVSELESGRDAYDSFFTRYPYCYGYWKKYADLEKRKGTKESTLKVFNRGVEAIPLSVDLWIHYMEYVTSKQAEDEEYVRQMFDRSIDACGLEFRSDKLWDLYILWENNCKRWKNITELYEKLLATPVSKYMQHWQKFQEHVKRHLPGEVVGVDEYLNLRKVVLTELNKFDIESPDEAPPGVETVPEDENVGVGGDDETKLMRSKIIEARLKIHENTATMAKTKWSYEDAIKRPYFHVKPLEKSQLNAWRSYLEYEIKDGDDKRIRVLFERCLIACAFYEEFWMRYIRYLEEHEATDEELREIYVRACTIHLREKLKPQLSWAAFEEEKGNPDYALQILVEVQSRIDLSLEAYMMAVGVERRRGNLDAAEEIYKSCLNKFKDKDDKSYYSCLATKYARFLTLFRNDSDKAIEVIQQAQENDPSNFNLLIALADNALACKPPKFDVAANAFKSGTDKSFSPTIRIMFAHRHLHFITECASESKSMNDALRLLRQIQQEIKQDHADAAEGRSSPNKIDAYNTTTQKLKQAANITPPTTDKSATNSMNGTVATSNANNAQTAAGYQNYQAQGYGYNQYQQGYGAPQYHQGWGYPTQQGGYGYNQQSWGSYPNYYGHQR